MQQNALSSKSDLSRFAPKPAATQETLDVVTQTSWTPLQGPSRAITVGTPGTLVVKRKSDGATVTIPQEVFEAQATVVIRAIELVQAGSSADNILVSY